MKSVPVSSAFFAAITTLLGQGAVVISAKKLSDTLASGWPGNYIYWLRPTTSTRDGGKNGGSFMADPQPRRTRKPPRRI
jgi:hypothetical protein